MSDVKKTPSGGGSTPSELDSYGVWVKPPKGSDLPSTSSANTDAGIKNDDMDISDIDLSQIADDDTGDVLIKSEEVDGGDGDVEKAGGATSEKATSIADEGARDAFDAIEDFMLASNDEVPEEESKAESVPSSADSTTIEDNQSAPSLPDGEVSLDDFMSDSGGGDGEVSLDDFLGDSGGSSSGGGGNGEVSLDDFMGGGDGDISLDDFMGEGFSAAEEKKEEVPDEPPLEMDLSFDAEPLETIESDDIGVEIEDVTSDDDYEDTEEKETPTEDSGIGAVNLDDFADVGDMFGSIGDEDKGGKDAPKVSSGTSASSAETEEVDLSDFGIDADAEETAVTSNVEENKGKVAVVDYDLTVSMDDDVAAAPVVSEVPQGKGQVQDDVNSGNNAALLEATETIKQIAASLTGLQSEIDSIKREMADIKEHGVAAPKAPDMPVAEVSASSAAEMPPESATGAVEESAPAASVAEEAPETPVPQEAAVEVDTVPAAVVEDTTSTIDSTQEEAEAGRADEGREPVVETAETAPIKSAAESTTSGEGKETVEELSFDKGTTEGESGSASSGFFSDDGDDDAIALSGDELSNMMSNAVVEEVKPAPETESKVEESASETETAERAPIESAAESTISGESKEPIEELSFDKGTAESESVSGSSGFFSDDGDDDAIALSGDELSNMMSNAVIEEEEPVEESYEAGNREEETVTNEPVAMAEGASGETAVDKNLETPIEESTETPIEDNFVEPVVPAEDEGLEDFSADFEEPSAEESTETATDLPEEISVPLEENFEEPEVGAIDELPPEEPVVEESAETEAVEERTEAAEETQENAATVPPVSEVEDDENDVTLSGDEMSNMMSNAVIEEEKPVEESAETGDEKAESTEEEAADSGIGMDDFSADFEGTSEGDNTEQAEDKQEEDVSVPLEENFEEPEVGAIDELPPEEPAVEERAEINEESTEPVEEAAETAEGRVETPQAGIVEEKAAESIVPPVSNVEEESGEEEVVPIASVDDFGGGAETSGNAGESTVEQSAEESAVEEVPAKESAETAADKVKEETVESELVAGESIGVEPLTESNLDYLSADTPLEETPPIDEDEMESNEPVLSETETAVIEPEAEEGAEQPAATAESAVETQLESTAGEGETPVGAVSEEGVKAEEMPPVAEERGEQPVEAEKETSELVAEDKGGKERETVQESAAADAGKGGVNIPSELQGEVKAVLMYMDELLENLPEDKIAEFARSEQFVTYKKLFDELGLS